MAGSRTRPTCIYQLDPTTLPQALQVTSNSRLTASNCGIMVNSQDSQALYVANSSNVTAQEISIVGGYRLASGGTVSPTPQTRQLSSPTTAPHSGQKRPEDGVPHEGHGIAPAAGLRSRGWDMASTRKGEGSTV